MRGLSSAAGPSSGRGKTNLKPKEPGANPSARPIPTPGPLRLFLSSQGWRGSEPQAGPLQRHLACLSLCPLCFCLPALASAFPSPAFPLPVSGSVSVTQHLSPLSIPSSCILVPSTSFSLHLHPLHPDSLGLGDVVGRGVVWRGRDPAGRGLRSRVFPATASRTLSGCPLAATFPVLLNPRLLHLPHAPRNEVLPSPALRLSFLPPREEGPLTPSSRAGPVGRFPGD